MQKMDKNTIIAVAKYCKRYKAVYKALPSTRTLAKDLNLSKSGAQRYMVAARNKGLIADDFVSSMSEETVPILGNVINCGMPQYQEEDVIDYVNLPAALYGRGKKFIVTASGDSMIDAGIVEGETLILRKQCTAEDGDIVAALLNGESTLKRLYHDRNGRPYLHPENEAYEDIVVRDGDDFSIQGVLIFALKAF